MNRPSSLSWRPATTVILIIGVVALLIGLVVAFAISSFKPTTQVRVASGVYNLWVADTEDERVQGLSGVKSLSNGGGLLMKFDTDSTWGIWMKDMEIPIDIVWLDKNKKVIYIVKNASPATGMDVTYTPKSAARYVIELTAGAVDKAGINVGSVATFDETDAGGGQ